MKTASCYRMVGLRDISRELSGTIPETSVRCLQHFLLANLPSDYVMPLWVFQWLSSQKAKAAAAASKAAVTKAIQAKPAAVNAPAKAKVGKAGAAPFVRPKAKAYAKPPPAKGVAALNPAVGQVGGDMGVEEVDRKPSQMTGRPWQTQPWGTRGKTRGSPYSQGWRLPMERGAC